MKYCKYPQYLHLAELYAILAIIAITEVIRWQSYQLLHQLCKKSHDLIHLDKINKPEKDVKTA